MDLVASVKEAADGRQIVHYDGHAFELTPSPGEVICAAGTGAAIHHRRDCMEVAPDLVELEVAVPHLSPAWW